jgi:DNA helicase HerA-like ATPase
MDPKFVASAREAFPADAGAVTLGAPLHAGECHPEPLVRIPLSMLNRHGLIAGATGTGKTKTLQLMAEQISAAGVPVFLADLKGDLSGLAAPGEASERVSARAKQTGYAWRPFPCPVEFLSLSGRLGAQLRATLSSFGPLLFAKVLGLNETQTSVLTMVFKWSDDRGLELYDFGDLRAVLTHLCGPGANDLAGYGGMSKATVGVLLRELVELEQQGALDFFGEPEFDLKDLLQIERDGRGLVSVLELSDAQDKPALFSSFMMWMLARLYATLPEVGDLEKPRLVFFFDEAHWLFDGASRAFSEQVEQVVRLVRSKGVGIFFVTQSPKDVPADILAQLGNRVQHALRAFTPDDEKALRAAARTFPRTDWYDVAETLTTLGIGEALVTVLRESGSPTPPFATRLIPPASRMAPLEPGELAPRLSTPQVRRYAEAVDRDSAEEKLARQREAAQTDPARDAPAGGGRAAAPERSRLAQVLNSPLARTVAGAVTRGLMGAILGPARRRRY